MANTLTYTDIANMAIDWCGGALSIADIEDQHNPDAVVCKRNMKMAVITELDRYEWAFARKSVVPVRDLSGENDIPGYITYVLPADFSRLSNYLFESQAGLPVVEEYDRRPMYFTRAGFLYCRREIDNLIYNSNNIPIRDWPSLFCDCVSLNLAQRIAGKMKGMDADIGFLEQLYKIKLKDARRCDLITTEATHPGFSVLQLQRAI